MFLCRRAQAQAVAAVVAPRGRTIPPRRDQGNAPKALTLVFRLRAPAQTSLWEVCDAPQGHFKERRGAIA